MNPILRSLILACFGYLTFMVFVWLSGWYEVSGDAMDGALRALAVVAGPLGAVLLLIADRA